MANRKLMFHIGSHKTGTTAIQSVLDKDRDRLASLGIHYPTIPRSFSVNSTAHHGIAHRTADFERLFRLRLSLYFRRLATQAKTYDLTLLSSEAVYRHVATKPKPRSADEWFASHEAYLVRLASYLRKFEVEIVLYLRNPHDFAVSLFKEDATKARINPIPPFVKVNELRSTHFDYARRIAVIEKVFGSVDVRHYEAEARLGLVPEFYRRLGVDVPKASDKPVRVSISNLGVLWLCARTGEGNRREHRHRVHYAASDPDGLFVEETPTTLWPSAEDLMAFVERHDAAYSMGPFDRPKGLDRKPTVWTDDAQRQADVHYQVWRDQNIDMLDTFDKEGGRHYHL